MMKTTRANSIFKTVFKLLYITFGILPIVAGLDKFTTILVDWEKYLSPWLMDLVPFTAHTFMMIVGVIEIIAGILVFIKPKIGGLIVAAWLVLIAFTLILSWQYVDVAVRDIVMGIAAFSMAYLARIVNESDANFQE